ncbi:hypothetical protein HMPREF1991_01826, partial [Hoylesella loescheii DSM 19665 = JCM 12249 = ATCC 15930]
VFYLILLKKHRILFRTCKKLLTPNLKIVFQFVNFAVYFYKTPPAFPSLPEE